MVNTGYIIFDLNTILTSEINPNPPEGAHPAHYQPLPTWNRMGPPMAHGTIQNPDTTDTRLTRYLRTATAATALLDQHKPDVLIIEGALDKGLSRSTTGIATYALITQYTHPEGPTGHHHPLYTVTLSPERQCSLAHNKRKAQGREKVQRAKTHYQYTPPRCSEHTADAILLAYYGTRFLLTLEGIWPHSILSKKETAIFHDPTTEDPKTKRRIASKSMAADPGGAWWKHPNPSNRDGQAANPPEHPTSAPSRS